MQYDYILLGGTVIGAFFGYFKGFLKQISSFLGLAFGYAFSSLFISEFNDLLLRYGLISKETSLWVSYICIFLIIFGSTIILSKLMETFLKKLDFDFTNKIAGIIVGAIKYFFIIMIVYCFLHYLNFINKENSSQNLIYFISFFKTVILNII